MKKILIILMMGAMILPAIAQTNREQMLRQVNYNNHFGVQIGFNRNLLREGYKTTEKHFPIVTDLDGIKIGVVYDGTIIAGFGVNMGINYTISGNPGQWQKNVAQPLKQERTSILFQNIEIPIDWQYKFEIAKNTYLILYTGPTIQYNFYHKSTEAWKSNILGNITSGSTVINQYDRDQDVDTKTDYTQLNITWGVGAGFQYERYFLRGGYDFGIYNPFQDRFDDINKKYFQGRFDQWSLKIGMYLWSF